MIFDLEKKDFQFNNYVTQIKITSIQTYLTKIDTLEYIAHLSNGDYVYGNSLNEVLKELDMLFIRYLKEEPHE